MAKYLNKKQRNQLLENQIARNRENMIETLRKARRRVEMRMIEAARNERFATVRRIRDGIYKDIGEEYKRLQGDLDEWTQDSILRTSKVYHGIAAADLLATDEDKLASSFTKFSAKHNEQYFAKVHPFNAEKLAAVNVHLNPQLVRMAETDVRALRTATVDALREAHIAGMTPQERYRLLRGKVMDLAENPKSWQFIDRSGRKWKKNNYFDMLNRTVTANVARDTYHDALADEQRDLVQIIGGTSADSNEACVKFDGKIVSMTGATSGFPTLDEYISEGGFHPNCVHSTAYVSKDFGPHRKLIEEQGGEIEEVADVVEFVPAASIEEARGRMIDMGFDHVEISPTADSKIVLDASNGAMRAVASGRAKPVPVVFEDAGGNLTNRGVVASHETGYFRNGKNHDGGRIRFSGDSKPSSVRTKKSFTDSSFRTTDKYEDFWEGVYVHEYGHEVEGIIDRSMQKRASDVLKSVSGNIEKENALARAVSAASGINHHELAAEAYAISVHPLYAAQSTATQREIVNSILGAR